MMIKKYLPQIRRVNINQQENLFNYDSWKQNFSSIRHLNVFKSLNGEKITRKDVIKQFKKYFRNPKKENVLTPFLLCMIWGYEGSGYGPSRASKYFADRDLKSKLKKAFSEINSKDVEAAFNTLTKIDYLSTSFASKVLYFAGKSKRMREYPLIFDMWAATGLVSLAVSGNVMHLVSISPKKGWAAYNNYCVQIHKWAKEYKVAADKIETFLFNLSKYPETKAGKESDE